MRHWRVIAQNMKLIGEALQPFVLIAGVIGAVVTFYFSTMQSYYQKQLDLYAESARVVAYLATASDVDSSEYSSNVNRFWELYWGDLSMVESPNVESLMVEFCLKYVSAANAGKCQVHSGSTSLRPDKQSLAIQLARQEKSEIKNRITPWLEQLLL